MKLTYIGPHDGVTVPQPLGGHKEVKQGEPTQLPDSLIEQLLEQSENWRPADAKAKAIAGRIKKDKQRAAATAAADARTGEKDGV